MIENAKKNKKALEEMIQEVKTRVIKKHGRRDKKGA